MTEKWIGKNAVVTGAASGIGAAIFKDFVKNKINVIGLDVNSETAKEAVEGTNKAIIFQCDITNPESVTEAFSKIQDQFGVLHIMVNCAGIGRYKAKSLIR